MEMKWAMIGMAAVFGAMFAGIGVSEYQKSQCRIAAIQAKMLADEIAKVCK